MALLKCLNQTLVAEKLEDKYQQLLIKKK